MAFKLEDFKCKDCNHEFEYLTDTREDVPCSCPKCNSTNVDKILSTGTGKKTHNSWSSWRM